MLYTTILTWLDNSKYVLLFLGAIVEGPVLMLTSGFFFHLGQFTFLPMYVALVSGDFVADMVWYGVGRFGARQALDKYGKFLRVSPEAVLKIEGWFKKYHERILIISKLTMGFGFALAVLVMAGILRVPFKKYAAINLLGGFVWTGFLVTLGFFFGNVFTLLTFPLKIVFLVIILLAVTVGIRALNRHLRNREI